MPPTAAVAAADDVSAAVSAPRHHDDARSALQHRLPLRRDLPGRAVSARRRRPDLAIALLEKGLRERPDKWEYMQDIGFVHYWYLHDYQRGRRLVRAGGRRAGRALVAALAGGDDAGAGRRPAVVARDVGGDSRSRPKSTGCATTPSAGCCSCRRSMRSTRCSARSTTSRGAPGSRA